MNNFIFLMAIFFIFTSSYTQAAQPNYEITSLTSYNDNKSWNYYAIKVDRVKNRVQRCSARFVYHGSGYVYSESDITVWCSDQYDTKISFSIANSSIYPYGIGTGQVNGNTDTAFWAIDQDTGTLSFCYSAVPNKYNLQFICGRI